MNTLLETYGTALSCATLLAAIQLFISSAFKFGPGNGVAGIALDGGHDSLPFRMERSHQNTVENLGLFTLTLVLAMIIGVAAAWVNWIALVFLIARAGHWLMYILNLQSIRTPP